MKKNSFISDQKGASAFGVIVFLLVLALVINAGVRYYAVVYNCESLKNEMKASVFLGQASSNGTGVAMEQARQRIARAVNENEFPVNTYIDVGLEDGQMYARVAFTQIIHLIPFGIYDYYYVFDETAMPTGFVPKASPGR